MAIIRVLQIFTIMDRGGSESMIMNYYRNIDKTKIQFDFLVHREEPGAFDTEIEMLGGKIYRFSAINPLNPNPYYNKLRDFFLNNSKYQVVHAHLNTFSSFPLKIAKEFNIPCRIAHAHIAMSKLTFKSIIFNKEGVSETLKKVIKLIIKRNITKYPTHYFACGEKAGKWLFGSNRFSIINNAIDSEKFIYNAEIAKIYKGTLKITNEIVIGHIGRFDYQKNHSFLLKIFTSLLIKHPNSRLILIGDGPLLSVIFDEAKNLNIQDKVNFLGIREDIPQLFNVMDVFVFPSIYEGLPVALIEAQASGTKILASNSISSEVKVTDLITFLPINQSPEFWSEKILSTCMKPIVKNNSKELIVKSGYDIIENTKKLETFYLKQNKRDGRNKRKNL